MKRKMRKHFSLLLVVALLVSSLFTAAPAKAEELGTIALTQGQVDELMGASSSTRTSVHDPSIVVDGDNYYIFGSHMGVSKTTDLQNWTGVTSEALESPLFGKTVGGTVQVVDFNSAFTANEYTGTVTILDAEGNPQQVDFGNAYNAAAWNTAVDGFAVAGNMWAPDVIYNDVMDKWCMYLSLNGNKWNSVIILLTADSIEGPYVYQGPVVYSGFRTTTDSVTTLSYKNTDLELVIGEQNELPAKYQYAASGKWGDQWPHAIDPAVMYDEAGKLWLTYGSWSGGIYMLELDENTGLRDYTVTYPSDYDTKGQSVTSDEYFGTKIAGGYYVSGEGAYIEKIGDYYYLFMSYGFYSPEGGYNMRIFRSENPNGPYVDGSGISAIFEKQIQNYSSTDTSNNRGEKLMANYKWDTMAKAEVAQGHNSAFVDDDGKAYVVYHTKFADDTANHQIRVHQLFVTENGWLAAAPYEYSGETISATGYSTDAVVGDYELIIHDYQIDYAKLAYKESETITLTADGDVTGAYTGSWSVTDGTPNVTLNIGGVAYKGVFVEQEIDGSSISVMCFTAVSDAGLCIWGSKNPTDAEVVAQNAYIDVVTVPQNAYGDIPLTSEGINGATLTWTSSNTAVLANDGKITVPAEDTVVTLNERISKGDYYFEKTYTVTVKAAQQNGTEPLVLASYFTDEAVDLSAYLDGSLNVANPFNVAVNGGLNISGGLTIEFDAESTGDMKFLGTIFAFMANGGADGRLYFTPGSYLGYNAIGGFFDANMKGYALVKDYIGDAAHIAITFTNEGFTVTANGEVAYTNKDISTNGSGTVTDYSKVTKWLTQIADKVYFGHGSFWNAAGWDESNIKISNVVCSVEPIAGAKVYDSVEYTKDSVVLATTDALTIEENPFYGKSINNLTVKYTIAMSEGAAQNGWDSIFSFFDGNSTATNPARVSFQTAPFIAYNDYATGYMDINRPNITGCTDVAPSMVIGTEYDVVLEITEAGAVFTVDGEVIATPVEGSESSYLRVLECITECNELCWGVGQGVKSAWWTEMCTLTDISFTSVGGVVTPDDDVVVNTNPVIEKDSIVIDANNYIEYIDNPFYNAEFDDLSVEYTINFNENAVMNGWDGLFAFYNTANTGRVSFQCAPFVCFNSMTGSILDVNNPDSATTGIAKYGLVPGVDYDINIVITADSAKMYIDGVEIETVITGNGATCADLLAFIKTCDKFSFGVGQAATTFWWTELCTITDLSISSNLPVIEKDTFTNTTNSSLVEIVNPFYGDTIDELHVDYNFTWNEGAVKNGFDGLFGFYNTTTTGKIGFVCSPGIAFNDMAGMWMDFNIGGETPAATLVDNPAVTIDITAEAIVVTVNGEVVTTFENTGTGATYADILNFFGQCDKFTFGVGQEISSPWWTELATVNDLVISPYGVTVADTENGTATATVKGNVVTLTATPAENAEFLGWYVNSLLIGTDSTMEITICDDVTVTPKFEEKVEEPSTEEPSTEEPSTEEPSTEEPSTEEPSTEEPSTEEPSTEEPSTEEPSTEEPSTEEPSTEEPSAEEPSTEAPSTEEPTTEAPTQAPVQQPIVNTDKPVTNITVNQQLDSDNIDDTFDKVKDGEALSVLVNKSEVSVPADVFAKAAEKNAEIIFNCGRYAWKFSDLDADKAVEVKSLNVDINANVPAVEEVLSGANVSSAGRRTVSFAHDGQLPGKAEVTIDVSGGFSNGKELFFYYFNEVSKGFELISKVTVANDAVVVTLTHCSDYVLTENELPAELVIATSTSSAPELDVETGDNSPIMVYVVLAMLSVVALMGYAAYDYKRKHNI